MSQHDFNIANQGFPATRSDINNALAALASTSSGTSEPSTTYANQFWYDTTNNLLKFRNEADSAWFTLAYLDQGTNEWEIRSAVIQAVDSAGITLKTDDGTARVVIQDDGDVAFDTDTLFVDAVNNRVGVGTSSPSQKLEVSGGSGDVNAVVTTTGASNQAGLTLANGTRSFRVIGDGSANALRIYDQTANSERLRIDSSGNVGIGTSSPDTKLHLDQTSQGNFTEAMRISNTGGGADEGNYIQFEVSNTSGYGSRIGGRREGTGGIGLHFYTGAINSAPTEAMRIDSSGNLLVGKTSLDGGASTGVEFKSTGETAIARSSGSNGPLYINRISNDGNIVTFAKDGSTVGSIGVENSDRLYIDSGSGNTGIRFDAAAWIPRDNGSVSDDGVDIGSNGSRFDDIYATNGTIQTSDQNEKQDIAELTDAEQRVAVAAKGLLRKFRWRDAVEEKGDEARTHFGIIAQDLQAAFTAEGLDAGDYAMFIHTTWTDEETGEERSRMGVRYSELLAFIIAAI